MDRAAIDQAVHAVMDASGERAETSPAVVTLLVREYVRTGGSRLRAGGEQAIVRGLAAFDAERDPCVRMQWIRAFAESATWCEDVGLGEWTERALPDAVDALESLVRREYEPGEGLVARPVGEQVQCALSLLASFDLSSRLPYAMLAEELLQSSRRVWWDAAHAWFPGGLVVNCRAARVLCGLAALRADPDYVKRAVVAPGQSYREDAGNVLTGLTPGPRLAPADAAEYGVALLDWFALDRNLH
ncbi:MAG: hypothetical protein AB7Q29_18030 [Vicinamibacterales bacterium]